MTPLPHPSSILNMVNINTSFSKLFLQNSNTLEKLNMENCCDDAIFPSYTKHPKIKHFSFLTFTYCRKNSQSSYTLSRSLQQPDNFLQYLHFPHRFLPSSFYSSRFFAILTFHKMFTLWFCKFCWKDYLQQYLEIP